jgi:hypothetical protein
LFFSCLKWFGLLDFVFEPKCTECASRAVRTSTTNFARDGPPTDNDRHNGPKPVAPCNPHAPCTRPPVHAHQSRPTLKMEGTGFGIPHVGGPSQSDEHTLSSTCTRIHSDALCMHDGPQTYWVMALFFASAPHLHNSCGSRTHCQGAEQQRI